MSQPECFRALGVAPDASWEEVRQAYKDLVRVWHPDRFQSDPKLRKRAEQKLQKINEAYNTLKNSHIYWEHQEEPAHQAAPPNPAPAASVHPGPRLQFGWASKAFKVGLVCVLPLIVAIVVANALRVPTLDSVLHQDSVPVGTDLWRSIKHATEKPVEFPPAAPNDTAPPKDVASRKPPRHRDIAAPQPVMPVNGTELAWTQRIGAGELQVSNQTGHDALATLVQAHTGSPVRAIYIQASNTACMRGVAPGLYELLAEVGEDWDPSHMRFRSGRHALERSGPFNFMDVTSAQGSTGSKYAIVLRSR